MAIYLIDTQILVWDMLSDPRFSNVAKERLRAADAVFISTASIWEIVIKTQIGKLHFARPLTVAMLRARGFKLLSIEPQHALETANLPLIHRDPFDRILIAQARCESLTLMSRDEVFAQYDVVLDAGC